MSDLEAPLPERSSSQWADATAPQNKIKKTEKRSRNFKLSSFDRDLADWRRRQECVVEHFEQDQCHDQTKEGTL